MNISTHFKILDINENASIEEIKAQYRKLVKQYHPDVGGDKQKFINLQASYEYLCANYRPRSSDKNYKFNKIDYSFYEKFFRVFDEKSFKHNKLKIELPIQKNINGVIINCLFSLSYMDKEFRIILNPGEHLPKHIKIKNILNKEFEAVISQEINTDYQ